MITVCHQHGAYEIRFAALEKALASLPNDARIITDRNVQEAWGASLAKRWPVYAVDPGEASKSSAAFEECHRWLVQNGAGRQSTLVALGGGVVGDLAGFVAATYMRGIRFVQIPTTLLSQVDSSVGGKVAIDLPEGKNLVGSFYPPAEVWICLETLKTLPWREFTNGMAEVWKYGFILDSELVRALTHLRLTPDSAMLESVVRRCVTLKKEVVEEDELDTGGARAVLNFGHTVGHALEKVDGYATILHGEAVAVGMVAEAKLGERIGFTERGTAEAIVQCLRTEGLPVWDDRLARPEILQAMYADKKTEGGKLAFALVPRIGECKLVREVPPEDVAAVLGAP